ncbi:hypothetical protein C8R46DRAFT_422148 [Mycena filopes]|nr:hypothetical protein C8R46DRAFT_422148 [Mycena filopes]
MAETSFLFFFLLALAQRSSSLSWSVPDLSNSENATSQISASSSTNYGLNVASDAQSFSAISRRPGPVLYPVTTTSASASAPIFSITQIFVPETTTINKNAPSGPVSSASGRSAVPSLPVSSGSAGSESGMPDSVTLVTTTGSAPTSTFERRPRIESASLGLAVLKHDHIHHLLALLVHLKRAGTHDHNSHDKHLRVHGPRAHTFCRREGSSKNPDPTYYNRSGGRRDRRCGNFPFICPMLHYQPSSTSPQSRVSAAGRGNIALALFCVTWVYYLS